MDFALRCNSLRCRKQLTERAVVTTCSHVFCNQCSDSLGLTAPAGGNRICPACQTVLTQPDDAVTTVLQPTEDYKTSVLSGLSPSTIMECAGRGLAFWSYQSTQEIVYQEYLAKTLTDKYGSLNVQMDKVIHDANSELNILNQRLNNVHIENEKLKDENTNIANAYRERIRKQQQTQELYDRLKRKEMTAATQSAAFDSVDEVLGNGSISAVHPQNHSAIPRPHRGDQGYRVDHNGIEQVHTHQRSGSNNSGGNGGMLPPPNTRSRVAGANGFGFADSTSTPSSHRTQLGYAAPFSSRVGTGGHSNSARVANRMPSPPKRQPFANLNANSVNNRHLSGYGMSAGMKIGSHMDHA